MAGCIGLQSLGPAAAGEGSVNSPKKRRAFGAVESSWLSPLDERARPGVGPTPVSQKDRVFGSVRCCRSSKWPETLNPELPGPRPKGGGAGRQVLWTEWAKPVRRPKDAGRRRMAEANGRGEWPRPSGLSAKRSLHSLVRCVHSLNLLGLPVRAERVQRANWARSAGGSSGSARNAVALSPLRWVVGGASCAISPAPLP